MSDKNARGITPMRAMSSFHHRYGHYRRHLASVLDSYLSSELLKPGGNNKKAGEIASHQRGSTPPTDKGRGHSAKRQTPPAFC
ncbi:hypothetical protein [Dickeya fangzhongdai]|uniref:hypothetical protein n=1 Tax=Dickeya fangzhongdai TaxID=1778540 RepID=UPI0023E3B200|nr:hypothetical protein [Dickeya fangzhongdai]WES87375.1 hypothetical protein PQ617_14120 [Dickeya fangzhongdai]